MQDAKEEVRARLAIEEVIGEYVQLKKAGRNFKGLSPFTQERTPSFTVSPEKQIWHDFSSGRGGDVFSFVMEVEGLEFRAALEFLARKAGVELAQFDSKKAGDLAKQKQRLYELHDLAAKYFQQCMVQNTQALEYIFKKRKLSKNIVQEFMIGYAPNDGEALVKLLKKRGFTEAEMSKGGVVNRFGGDLFRGRMMVSLMDGSGQVIGFTARVLQDEPNAPKYLNTPATVIYDKSRHVFGLSQAKEAIRKNDQAVIVEGNLDVVSSHQAGVKNVVATAGTAMTEQHLKALSRLTHNISLAFDGDKAGIAATERAIVLAQTAGVELTIISLPGDAKDPDELIQQDVKLWEAAISNTQPAIDWIIDQYATREDMTSAKGKRTFTTVSLDVLRKLTDSVETEHYLKKIAEMTDSTLEAVQQKFTQTPEGKQKSLRPIKEQPAARTISYNSTADNAIAMLVSYPHTRSLLMNPEYFQGEPRQKLASYIQKHPTETLDPLPKELQQYETYAKIVQLKAETRYADWNDSDIELETARLLRQIEIQHKKQEKETLLEELRAAEADDDEARASELRERLHQLIKETSRG